MAFPQANFETLVKEAKLVNGFYDIKLSSFIIADKKLKEIEKRLKIKPCEINKYNLPKIIYNEC